MPDLHASLDRAVLKRENRVYGGTSGVSDGCRQGCFKPAFLDQETGLVYLSRHPDGHVSTVHMLDGLPDEVVAARYANGNVSKAKNTLISGFLKGCAFYTRQEAAGIADDNRREQKAASDPDSCVPCTTSTVSSPYPDTGLNTQRQVIGIETLPVF